MAWRRAESDDTDGVVALPGAASLLESLPADRWAVATSGSRRLATTRLAHGGLPLPRVLVTAEDVERGKPDPQPYLAAAAALGVEASRCLVVEDAPAGIAAGKAAGAAVLAVTTTFAASALGAADYLAPSLAAVTLRSVADGGELELVARALGGLLPDRDVLAALARERLPLPPAPALAQRSSRRAAPSGRAPRATRSGREPRCARARRRRSRSDGR